MNLVRQLFAELYSMFAGDRVLTIATLGVVAVAAVARFMTPVPRLAVGATLVVGCLVVLVIRVRSEARKRRGR
jgi:hypothetical protein